MEGTEFYPDQSIQSPHPDLMTPNQTASELYTTCVSELEQSDDLEDPDAETDVINETRASDNVTPYSPIVIAPLGESTPIKQEPIDADDGNASESGSECFYEAQSDGGDELIGDETLDSTCEMLQQTTLDDESERRTPTLDSPQCDPTPAVLPSEPTTGSCEQGSEKATEPRDKEMPPVQTAEEETAEESPKDLKSTPESKHDVDDVTPHANDDVKLDKSDDVTANDTNDVTPDEGTQV